MSNGITKGGRPPFGSKYEDTLKANPMNSCYDKFPKGDGTRRATKSAEELNELR